MTAVTLEPVAPRALDNGRMTTLVGSVAVFNIGLELTIIALALPAIAEDFPGASPATLSWIFTAYNVTVASLLLLFGWAAERHGRKRIFTLGLMVFGFGSLTSGLAPTIALLIVGRVVQAVGGAMLIPASLALILASVPPTERDRAIGVWGAAAGLSAAIGPSLGSVLIPALGWRSVFFVNLPLVGLSLVVARRRLVESLDPGMAPRVDPLAVPCGAAAVGLLVFTIVAGGSLGWASPTAIGLIAVAVALMAVFSCRSLRHPRPVIEPAVVQTRSFTVAAFATVAFVAGFTGWIVLAPTFLTQVWGYSVLTAGLAIAPGPLVMAVLAGPAGRLASRVGHGRVVAGGAVLAVGACGFWLITTTTESRYLTTMLPGQLLLGAGVAAAFPMLTAAALSEVEDRRFAMAAAGNTTVRQVSMAIGIAIAVAMVGGDLDDGAVDGVAGAAGRQALLDSFRLTWTAAALLFVIGGVIALALPNTGRSTSVRSPGIAATTSPRSAIGRWPASTNAGRSASTLSLDDLLSIERAKTVRDYLISSGVLEYILRGRGSRREERQWRRRSGSPGRDRGRRNRGPLIVRSGQNSSRRRTAPHNTCHSR